MGNESLLAWIAWDLEYPEDSGAVAVFAPHEAGAERLAADALGYSDHPWPDACVRIRRAPHLDQYASTGIPDSVALWPPPEAMPSSFDEVLAKHLAYVVVTPAPVPKQPAAIDPDAPVLLVRRDGYGRMSGTYVAPHVVEDWCNRFGYRRASRRELARYRASDGLPWRCNDRTD